MFFGFVAKLRRVDVLTPQGKVCRAEVHGKTLLIEKLRMQLTA
jgi:hypothetical protein